MYDILIILILLATVLMLVVVGYSFLKNKLSPIRTIGAVVDRKWISRFLRMYT